jgi:hypothetical protein
MVVARRRVGTFARVERMREAMRFHELDAMLMSEANVEYLSASGRFSRGIVYRDHGFSSYP